MAKKSKQKKGRTLPRAERYRPAPAVRPQGVELAVEGEAAPMPEPAEGLLSTPMLFEGEAVTLHVPTAALLKIAQIAKDEELERALANVPSAPSDSEVQTDSSHALASLTRITGEDGTDFVRAHALIHLRSDDHAIARGWKAWIDLPTRYVGMMLEASKPRDTPSPRFSRGASSTGVPVVSSLLDHSRPKWAGSWTFDKVYDRQIEITRKPAATGRANAHLVGGTGRIVMEDPKFVLGVEAIRLLDKAHLLRIEADQVELLPDWEVLGDAWDFSDDAHLPFDPIYFEFEGAGGVAPAHEVVLNLYEDDDDNRKSVVQARGAMVLRGALMWRGESEFLTVEPFGDVYLLEEGESFRSARKKPSVLDARAPAGRVTFGREAFVNATIGPQRIVAVDDEQREIAEAHPVGVSTSVFTEGKLPGIIVLPFSWDSAEKQGWDGAQVTSWASVVLSMSLRALACLSIMETEAVVVEDAPMEVRDRKRADKRGWKIAQQVYVRPTRKGGARGPATGNEREYSHRFWVSGHYKHFPLGTRMADNRPDLVKPCTRTGEASCGVCRRIWTPPFIKGPDDKPLVVKSLVRRAA